MGWEVKCVKSRHQYIFKEIQGSAAGYKLCYFVWVGHLFLNKTLKYLLVSKRRNTEESDKLKQAIFSPARRGKRLVSYYFSLDIASKWLLHLIYVLGAQ
jgi:hypothetical protein